MAMTPLEFMTEKEKGLIEVLGISEVSENKVYFFSEVVQFMEEFVKSNIKTCVWTRVGGSHGYTMVDCNQHEQVNTFYHLDDKHCYLCGGKIELKEV